MQKILHILLGTVAIVALVGCGGGGGGGSTAETAPSSVKYVALSAPSNLAAQALSATHVKLTWTDSSNGAVKYRIYRDGSTTANNWQLAVKLIGVSVSSLAATSLQLMNES